MHHKGIRHLLVLIPLWIWSRPCHCLPQDTAVQLPNGLRIVVRERHASKLVAIDLWVRAGASEERPGEEGSAHFLEHTLFKGTRTRGPGEADSAIEDLGATLDAATGPDGAHFYTTVATQHVHGALAILADVIRNATLPDAEVERERGVILDELAQHCSQPSAVLVDTLYSIAFPAQPYGRSPGGTEADIRARSRASLLAFYRRTYTPDRIVLAFAGDITPESAVPEATQVFGDWTATETRRKVPPAADEPDFPFHLERLAHPEAVCRLGIAFLAPAARNASMVCAAQVARVLLGRTDGYGRLRAIPVSGTVAETNFSPRQGPSLFYITATVDTADHLPAVENALLSAVRELDTQLPSVAEFNAAKARVLSRARFDLETNAGLARTIGFAQTVDGDTPEEFQDHIQALTRTDFKRFLEKYLDPKRCVVVRFEPEVNGTETKP